MKWRASQLGNLMTNSKSKSEVLSETTKSEIRKIAKQDFYGYHTEIKTKPMMKGTDWEQIKKAFHKNSQKFFCELEAEQYYNETFKSEQ